jgi:anti-anti-sigma factor
VLAAVQQETMQMVTDDLTVTSRPGVVVVAGEIDISNARALDEHLSAVDRTLALDLTGVPFLGSAGINVLVQQRHRRGSGRVRILAMSPTVRRMLEITDLTCRFADRGRGVGAPAVGYRRLTWLTKANTCTGYLLC